MTQSIFFWSNGNFAIALNVLNTGTIIADKTVILNQLKRKLNLKSRQIKNIIL